MWRRVVPLVLVLFLSGCFGDGAPSDDADETLSSADALALLRSALPTGHDHTDPHLHPHAEWNLREVFETNVPTDGVALSPPSEFQFHGDHAFLSVFHPSAGMVIMDLSDPARPVQVGRFDTGTAYVNDVEISDDGRWAFLPTSPIETRENDPTGDGLLAAGDYGIQVVDVSDPTAPELAAVWYSPDPDPRRVPVPPPADPTGNVRQVAGMGYHRLDIETIDGVIYVAGAPLGYPRLDILRFDTDPTPRLSPVSFYLSEDAQDPTLDTRSSPTGYGIHDVTFDPDPLQGFPLIAVSHWRSGAHFLDASDPANPVYLGRWNDFPDEGGNVHNVEFTAVEGRRVAVAVPEYPVDSPTQGYIAVIDVTEFSSPVNLAAWRLPGDFATDDPPAAGEHVFSTNRVELHEGLVFDAHFHAGLIVLDIGTLAKAAAPEMVAFVVPKGETRVPYATIAANPYVYDAIPRGAHVYYTDLTGGFHVAEIAPPLLDGRTFPAPGT